MIYNLNCFARNIVRFKTNMLVTFKALAPNRITNYPFYKEQ